MIQDYRNQGVPSFINKSNEGQKMNLQNQSSIKNGQQSSTADQSFYHEPCVTDYFYRKRNNTNR